MSDYIPIIGLMMNEDVAAERLRQTYGLDHATRIVNSTDILFYIDRTAWADMAKNIYFGNDIFDFTIDDKSEMAFVNIRHHYKLISALYQARAGDFPALSPHEIQDEWVLRGFGCFMSKAGHYILMSEDYAAPAALNLLRSRFDRIAR